MDVRKDFPIMGRGITYFDSAATSQKPLPVIRALEDFYEKHNANIHRGIHTLSEEATEMYEESKRKVAKFVGAPSWQEVIYVKNATEGLNFAANMIDFSKGDRVVTTVMEHHSNILPWFAKRSSGVSVEFVDIDDRGELNMDEFAAKVRGARVVAVAHASNVVGTINPVKEIARIAHEEGALVVVDAAQSVPHMEVSMKDLGADFLAFSGHKMLAPAGTGALCVRRELVEDRDPILPGGGTVEDVTTEGVKWAGLPEKFEGGTPFIEGAVALGADVDYLSRLGMDNVRKHEIALLRRFFEHEMSLEVYGPPEPGKRTGLVAFNLPGVHAHDVADFLSSRKIAVRSGKHCADPLHYRLGIPASVRSSFHVYNMPEEIDRMFEVLEEVAKVFP